MSVPSKDVLNVAKVFSTNGTLEFKRRSKKSFTIPIFNSPVVFSLHVLDEAQFILTPLNLTLQSESSLTSVRDLLNEGLVLRRAYFLCYSDQNVLFSDRSWFSSITFKTSSVEYSIRCKIFLSKYRKFYSALVPKSRRQHYIVQIKHVSAISKRCSSP